MSGGANRFGERFQFTTFGESHGAALGVVIDGCPAGIEWRQDWLESALERRRPGQKLTTSRREGDAPEILSGVYQGKTLGTPIAILTRNHDARSQDYAEIAKKPRTGHADDVWVAKFGHVDPRGGGRSSGRETVARVMAGAVAEMLCRTLHPSMRVLGIAVEIGNVKLSDAEQDHWRIALESSPKKRIQQELLRQKVDEAVVRFPSSERNQKKVERLLQEAKEKGLSYGGKATVLCSGVPVGLGQPVFYKFKSEWARALLSLGAAVTVEIGEGGRALHAEGSQFHREKGSRRYGGIRGGITTGELLEANVGFKPTSSVLDVAQTGRHDPCIVPRAIPVLEAMTWCLLADQLLWNLQSKTSKV